MTSTNEQIAEDIAAIRRDIAEMKQAHIGLLLAQPSSAEAARKAGCSRATLWRRKQRLRINQLLGG